MASSTMFTFLMHNTALSESPAKWEKLIDIKDFGDLGGAPEMIDVTTLSDTMQRNVPGIQKMDAVDFTANYDPADYEKVKALENKDHDFAVWFGGSEALGVVTPKGDLGKWKFSGKLSVYIAGKGTNDARDMKINIAASTPIVPDKGE